MYSVMCTCPFWPAHVCSCTQIAIYSKNVFSKVQLLQMDHPDTLGALERTKIDCFLLTIPLQQAGHAVVILMVQLRRFMHMLWYMFPAWLESTGAGPEIL